MQMEASGEPYTIQICQIMRAAVVSGHVWRPVKRGVEGGMGRCGWGGQIVSLYCTVFLCTLGRVHGLNCTETELLF